MSVCDVTTQQLTSTTRSQPCRNYGPIKVYESLKHKVYARTSKRWCTIPLANNFVQYTCIHYTCLLNDLIGNWNFNLKLHPQKF